MREDDGGNIDCRVVGRHADSACMEGRERESERACTLAQIVIHAFSRCARVCAPLIVNRLLHYTHVLKQGWIQASVPAVRKETLHNLLHTQKFYRLSHKTKKISVACAAYVTRVYTHTHTCKRAHTHSTPLHTHTRPLTRVHAARPTHHQSCIILCPHALPRVQARVSVVVALFDL